MLLIVDAGNTNICLAVYNDENEPVYTARIYTERRKTSDQYAYDFKQILTSKYADPALYRGAVISSVVPEITKKLEYAAHFITGKKPLVLGVGVKTHLQINTVNRGELGADLVAGAVGAKAKYPMPCLIWDLGTCTKISVLGKNGEYLGCTISPGIKMAIEALGSNTSQLNQIDISDDVKCFGATTEASISAGVITGTAVMLEGLSERILSGLGYEHATIVLTGGCASYVLPAVHTDIILDPSLVADGLCAIFSYNEPEADQ